LARDQLREWIETQLKERVVPETEAHKDIATFIWTLLQFGHPRKVQSYVKLPSIKALLSEWFFHQKIALKGRPTVFPSTSAGMTLLPSSVLRDIQPIRDVLDLLDALHKHSVKRVRQNIIEIARIPKIQKQIGSLDKDLSTVTEEEWSLQEQKWERKMSEAYQFLLWLFNLAKQTPNFEQTTPASETLKPLFENPDLQCFFTLHKERKEGKLTSSIEGLPMDYKPCLCMAMALFIMADKRGIQESDASLDIPFLSHLLQFTYACWIIAAKLTEISWNDDHFLTFHLHFLVQWWKFRNITQELTYDRFRYFQQSTTLLEVTLTHSLDYHLWSPLHIEIFCFRDTLEQPLKFRFGAIDDPSKLFEFMIAALKDSDIRLFVVDVNVFTNSYTDVNLVNAKNSLEIEISQVILDFFNKLYEAEIMIYLVSGYDPTNSLQTVTKRSIGNTAGESRSKYSLLRLFTSASQLASEAFVQLRSVVYPSSVEFESVSTLDKSRSFVGEKIATAFHELEEKSANAWKQSHPGEERKNPYLERWSVISLDEMKEMRQGIVERKKTLYLVSFNPANYMMISKKSETAGDWVAKKLWLASHIYWGDTAFRKSIGKKKFDELLSKEKKGGGTGTEEIWKVEKSRLGSGIVTEDEKGQSITYNYWNTGLNLFIQPETFSALGIRVPVSTSALHADYLFYNTDSLKRFQDNFLLHLGICIKHYSELRETSVSARSVLFLSGDSKSLTAAATACVQTLTVPFQFGYEDLQNYILSKVFELSPITCEVNTRLSK
jgi:hypothetical protein